MNNITLNILPDDFKPLPIYLNTVSANYTQGSVVYKDGCSFHQVLFVLEGRGTLICDGKKYRLEKGCGFYNAAGFPLSYYGKSGLITAFVTIKGDGANDINEHFGCGGFAFYKNLNIKKFESDVKEIVNEYYTYKRQSVLSALAYSFFVNFFESQEAELNLMKKIALYTEKNFTGKLTLTHLAGKFGISVSKLCHDFKKEFGCTVFEYIMNLRLSYAKNILQTNKGIRTKEVAMLCGFDDSSYFCKAYKAKYGINPSTDKNS